MGSSCSLGIVGFFRRTEESLPGARQSILSLGSSCLLVHYSLYSLTFRAGTATDGGQFAKLCRARVVSDGL